MGFERAERVAGESNLYWYPEAWLADSKEPELAEVDGDTLAAYVGGTVDYTSRPADLE